MGNPESDRRSVILCLLELSLNCDSPVLLIVAEGDGTVGATVPRLDEDLSRVGDESGQ